LPTSSPGAAQSRFHAPALAELPDLDPQAIAALIASLEQRPAKLAIFQTGVGTRALFAATDSLSLPKNSCPVERHDRRVRGPKPTGALRQRGVHVDRSAADPFTTRELLDCIDGVPLKGVRVIVQRHGTANRELDAALRGARRRGDRDPDLPLVAAEGHRAARRARRRLERGEMDAVLFTNAEQVRNLFAVSKNLNKDVQGAPQHTFVASIGPVASAALRDAGVKIALEASRRSSARSSPPWMVRYEIPPAVLSPARRCAKPSRRSRCAWSSASRPAAPRTSSRALARSRSRARSASRWWWTTSPAPARASPPSSWRRAGRRLHLPHRQPVEHPGEPAAHRRGRLPAADGPRAGEQGELLAADARGESRARRATLREL
jgi:uroporphyrinogen-III synthase